MSTIDSGPVSAAASGNGTPLGQILAERGLISEEQLAYALAEGQRTGEPIGVVIVRLGFAHSATIAQALATQAGGPTKSEYGYAVGFAPPAPAAPAPAAPPVSHVPAQELRPADPVPVSAVQAVPAVEVVPVPAPTPAPVVPDPELARLEARVEDLAGDLDAARRETRTIAASLAQSELERVALDKARAAALAQNAELAKRLAELEAAAAVEPEPEPARFADATSHLLFVAGPEGYTLVEREGPPPAPGSTLELANARHVVTKVAAGPLPGRREACAYLALV